MSSGGRGGIQGNKRKSEKILAISFIHLLHYLYIESLIVKFTEMSHVHRKTKRINKEKKINLKLCHCILRGFKP